jgi:branched-chain amino acid transport system permease protein
MRYVEFWILGFGTGAVVAALALGLVVAYRASGVINFGHGAIAAYTAYTYNSIRSDGLIPLPPLPNPVAPIEAVLGIEILDLPTSVSVGGSVPVWSAVALSLLTAGIIGLVIHYAVFRPLRYAPILAKVVASVGIMIFIQGAIVIRFGSRSSPAERILPDTSVDWLGATLPVDRYLLLGLVVVLTAGLWALFRFTRFGLATRAAAENERFATLLGVNADAQAAVSWVMAAMLAGLVGILASPIVGLSPNLLTLFVIPALGAALLGRMSSFVVAAAAGLGIGATQSVLFLLEQRADWVPDINLPQALPFVVIALAMIIRGEALPSRGAITAERLPDPYVPRLDKARLLAYGALGAGTVWLAMFAPFEYRAGLINTLVGVVLALSLVVVTGYVGQISLMQMALAGIAGYGVATFLTDMGLSLPLAVVPALGAAVIVGLITALPSLRTRGASLAIITLASGLAIQEFLFKHDGWFGSGGTRNIDAPSLLGFEFGPNSSFPVGDGKIPSVGFSLFLVVITIVCAIAVMRLRRSRLGEQMLAVRSNERAASAAGINVPAVKLLAFAISALIAGLAGTMTAWKLGQFTSDTFGVFASLSVLAFAYLGGISTVGGAVVAGTLFTGGIGVVVIEELLNLDAGRYTGYVAGLALIVTAVVNSEGIDGFQRNQFFRFVRRFRGAPVGEENERLGVAA